MKNIHILPTDKPSRLWKNNLLQGKLRLSEESLWFNTAQNIYITSDEEIKYGDWYIIEFNGTKITKCTSEQELISIEGRNDCQKIILTTDQDLIKDGLQAIDDEFLEWFCKNPSCEEVEIVFNNRGISGSEKILKSFGEYKIIIPKEEKLTYSDALKKEERIFNSTMMFKQETIEEVAEKILANNVDGLKDALQDNDLFFFYKGVIQCYGEAMAKWQQEQMYSEEEALNLLTHFAVEIQRQNKKGQYPIEIKGWFERNKEKFKKK